MPALEDDFSDIVKKARVGHGRALADIARTSGLSVAELSELERGSRTPTGPQVHGLATALGLVPEALYKIAIDGWAPSPTPVRTACLETVMGDIGGYAVKGYVLYDAEAGEAMIIDTGYNPGAMLEFLRERRLRLTAVGLTHGHTDHAGGLEPILARWPVPVYLGGGDRSLLAWHPPKERLMPVGASDDGLTMMVGRLTVRMMTTPGHTPGGLCYRIEHGDEALCFVGDTLFAGSIGRTNPSSLYPTHLASVRRQVLTLAPSTVLLPGHGPSTTVAEERRYNPFASAGDE